MHRAPLVVSAGAALVLVATLLSGCGGDSGQGSGGASTDKKSDSPGQQLTGMYDAVITTLTVNGKPADQKLSANRPSTRKWLVQSTCDGPGDSCVAIAADVDPGKGALTQERMEFVYENGTWTRVVETPKRDCTANATKKVVDEPWVELHSTTIKATGATTTTTTPIAALTGTIENVQGGTCFGVTRGEVQLRRTGELPADAKPLEKLPAPAAVANPPGAALRGTYDFVNKVLRADPPSYGKAYGTAPQKSVVTPLCTRDGTTCVSTIASAEGQVFAALSYAGGSYQLDNTSPPYSCGNGANGYSTTKLRITATPGQAGPAATAKAIQDVEYRGGCPGSVSVEGTLTRTGD